MKWRCWTLLAFIGTLLGVAGGVLAQAPGGAPGPANLIRLSNQSGVAIANYPLQFGRPFRDGVIPSGQCPVVFANGTRLATQADIKNSYPDGSVEYAIIAVVIPSISSSGSVTLAFTPSSCNNTPQTQAQMLASAYNFDAVMSFTGTAAGASAQTVSARSMLTNGDYTLWTSGPIAQTVELADDSVARKYDIGFGDGYHPLRPRFYATFWPATHQVSVRAVAENMLTSELEDAAYTFTITAGQAGPSIVYSGDLPGTQTTNAKKHWALTSWTKRFWLNGAPPDQINIDNNLGYLASTRFLPNYDTSIQIPQSAISVEYGYWTDRPHDLYDGTWDAGVWTSAMSTTGARPEIAPYPQWSVMWLYTGDWRMRVMALGMADLAAAFPGQLRESAVGKRLSRADPPGSSTGLGRTVSLSDRKTLLTSNLDYYYTQAPDAVTFVGPTCCSNEWSFDGAHQPSPFYPQYVLTGDPWYLNEMYLWAGFSAGRYNGGDSGNPDGRGPTGAEGVINDQFRGAAWVLRNRAETAFIAPDSDPEKAYFTYLTNDALARWEGSLGITGTVYDGTAVKQWGATVGNYYGAGINGQLPPLGNWDAGYLGNNSDPSIQGNEAGGIFVPGAVGTFTAPWMHWYFDYAMGRTTELGFAANALRLNHGQFVTGMINNSGVPTMVSVYELPIAASCANTSPPYSAASPGCTAPPAHYFDWPGVVGALTPAFLTGAGWNPANGADLPQYFANNLIDDGRPIWEQAGLAMMVDHGDPGAAPAWSWFLPNVYRAIPLSDLQGNPKWVIVPRTDSNRLPAQPTATPSSANAT